MAEVPAEADRIAFAVRGWAAEGSNVECSCQTADNTDVLMYVGRYRSLHSNACFQSSQSKAHMHLPRAEFCSAIATPKAKLMKGQNRLHGPMEWFVDYESSSCVLTHAAGNAWSAFVCLVHAQASGAHRGWMCSTACPKFLPMSIRADLSRMSGFGVLLDRNLRDQLLWDLGPVRNCLLYLLFYCA